MEKPFNWLVDNINISGIAIYEEEFTKEDLEQIQKIYDNNKINIDFENKSGLNN